MMISSPARKNLIAFVSNNAWSMYNYRGDVIQELVKSGYRIVVIAPEDEYVPGLKALGCHYIPIHFNNKKMNPFKDMSLYFTLKKIYRQIKPDFIFHYVIKPNIYGTMAAHALNIRSVAVVTGLGYPFAKKNWLFSIVKLLYKFTLRNANEVWFLNNEDARIFLNEKLIQLRNIQVLPGEGVNIGHFKVKQHRSANKQFTFLMSSRLLKSKGVNIYADAALILKRKNYDVRFELLGLLEETHPDSISVNDLEKWQKSGLIHYHGFVRDVRPYLQRADCFVFPSFYHEGIPRCLMEAASMELPVITTLQRGCREVVINNLTGYLCQINDPFDLADKMERILNISDEESDRMGKQGRMLVSRKFDIEKIIDIYKQVLSSHVPD